MKKTLTSLMNTAANLTINAILVVAVGATFCWWLTLVARAMQ